MKVLTIIGNGFDLGHCLPTKFEDFIKSRVVFEEKYSIFKKGNNNWNEIEKRYSECLCEVMKQRSWIDSTEIVENIINEYGLNQYGEVDYYNYNSDLFGEEHNNIIALITRLTEFERDFLFYLRKVCSDKEIQRRRNYQKTQNLLDLSTRIINFNYTKTIEILYGIQNVCHIHGSVNDKIAIGSGALEDVKESQVDIEYPTIDKFEPSKYGFQEMMRYYEEDMAGGLVENHFIKRFFDEVVQSLNREEKELFELLDKKNKDSLVLRKTIINELKNTMYDKVYIIGHSLEDSDFSVLDSINKDAEVVCFYFDDEDARRKACQIEKLKWNCKLISSKLLFKS